MENYMDDKIVIGDYIVSGIEMLDDYTCVMYFKEFTEGNVMYGIVVEYWLDDDSWHFLDNKFTIDGYFINSEESTHLLEDDKQKCKEIIENWLEDLTALTKDLLTFFNKNSFSKTCIFQIKYLTLQRQNLETTLLTI